MHALRFIVLVTGFTLLLGSSPLDASNARESAAGTPVYGEAAFRIKVPRAGASAGRALLRVRPHYVSAATKSFVILTDGRIPVVANIDTTTGYATVYVRATVATHTFTVTAYDRPGGKGNILSTGMTQPVAVPVHGYAYIYLTLEGVVASVTLALAHTLVTIGGAAVVNLNVIAADADGYAIIGSGAPAPAFTQPITLTSSDPHNGTLSRTVLGAGVIENPIYGDRVSVAYSGANVSRIVFSATGAGLTSVTPSVLVPQPPPAGQQLILNGGYDPATALNTPNGNQVLATLAYDARGPVAVDDVARLIYAVGRSATGTPVIQVYRAGGADAFVTSLAVAGHPAYIAVDSGAKRLYLTDAYGFDISVFSIASGVLVPIGTITPALIGYNTSAELAIDTKAQRLYLCGHAGIQVFNTFPPYKQVATLPQGGSVAVAGPIAVDPVAGRLYAVEYTDPNDTLPTVVDVYDSSTLNLITTIGGRFGPYTGGIALDTIARRLYVQDQPEVSPYNTIVDTFAIDSGYTFLGSFTGQAESTFIAVAP